MWCWRMMEKFSWTDHVRNEEVLLRVNEQRNTLHEIRKRKANWIGHILRRNWLLKQVIEGKIKGQMEVTRRRGRRCKELLDELKDRRGYSHLKEETLDRTVWRNRFGGGFGPVIRQYWMNEWIFIRFPPKCLLINQIYILDCSNFTSTVMLSKVMFRVYFNVYKLEATFSPNFFPFPQSIIFFLLFCTHLQPLPEFFRRSCQAVYYHIRRPETNLTSILLIKYE